MATIQTRTTKTGLETHWVGYYIDGKVKWTPTLGNLDSAKKIKHIIEPRAERSRYRA